MPTIRNIVPPNYPIAPREYSQQAQDQYTNILRLFSNTVTNAINAPKIYGSFYDTTTQTNPVANVARAVTLNSIASLYGTKLGNPTSRVYVSDTGVYNVQFSVQADKTGGGADPLYIWLRVNGADISYSASKVVVNGPNDENIPAWNFLIVMEANDYFELMWSSSDTTMHLEAIPAAAPVPAIPSVILTVAWVSNIAL